MGNPYILSRTLCPLLFAIISAYALFPWGDVVLIPKEKILHVENTEWIWKSKILILNSF